jgi:hypothetical protein
MGDFALKWQELIGAFAGGVIGFAAAIVAVRWTLLSERRREKKELESVKRVLGAEIRQYAHQALDAHGVCKKLAEVLDRKFALNDILNAGRFPAPVIYANVAHRLGMMGDEAHWIVFFYAQIQAFVEMRSQMQGLANVHGYIGHAYATSPAEAMLKACEAAVHVLPLVKAGNFYSDQDRKFGSAVSAARDAWQPEQKMRFTSPMS